MAGRWAKIAFVLASALGCGVASFGSQPSPYPASNSACDDRRYAVFDALFLQRNNASVDRPIVVDSTAPNVAVLSSQDLQSSIGTGMRLLVGNYGPDGRGWEAGYMGVYGMYADTEATSAAGNLQATGDLGQATSGLNDASAARLTYSSQLNSAEVNFVCHDHDGGYRRSSGRPWQRCHGYDGGHVDWLAGFRWAGLDESAVLGLTPADSPVANTYGVHTSSNLFAPQVGVRARMAFQRWAVEGSTKLGIAGTVTSQSQTMFDQLSLDNPYRGPRSAQRGGMGMIADMNLSAIYRLNDTWGLRAGYNLFWLTGVALAPDQWDFSAGQTAADGTGLTKTGSLFLSGANLGLEARW
jgi:hypothetical protein